MEACRPPRIVKLFEKYTRTSHAARALEKLWHSEELGLGTALFFDPSDGFVTARYPPYPAVSPLSQLWSSKNTTTGGANLYSQLSWCKNTTTGGGGPNQSPCMGIHYLMEEDTSTPVSFSFLSFSLCFFLSFLANILIHKENLVDRVTGALPNFFFFRKKRNIFGSQQEERNVAFPTVQILHILARKKA